MNILWCFENCDRAGCARDVADQRRLKIPFAASDVAGLPRAGLLARVLAPIASLLLTARSLAARYELI